MRNHPVIERMEQHGFLTEQQHFGNDANGNEVFVGDVIFEFNEEFWLEDQLGYGEVQILKTIGAERKLAQ
ncbi:hypothetical protein F9U64_01325 [Gracilibacillus oryzae]|uniref:YopX protein domain-containing protein n=1 Tax=Gracilibacillus oryzae TaxID=1672701 RepID=A0A7C8KU83_9BACI|nr:hypothetical protein [Gracilibacillus oryzae]KAB8139067.1 hypothetical protein F9U64_01325 [Gracilibacillus oryzae]